MASTSSSIQLFKHTFLEKIQALNEAMLKIYKDHIIYGLFVKVKEKKEYITLQFDSKENRDFYVEIFKNLKTVISFSIINNILKIENLTPIVMKNIIEGYFEHFINCPKFIEYIEEEKSYPGNVFEKVNKYDIIKHTESINYQNHINQTMIFY